MSEMAFFVEHFNISLLLLPDKMTVLWKTFSFLFGFVGVLIAKKLISVKTWQQSKVRIENEYQ